MYFFVCISFVFKMKKILDKDISMAYNDCVINRLCDIYNINKYKANEHDKIKYQK